MTEQRVRQMVQKFFRNQCSPGEKEELARWIAESGNDPKLKEILEDAWSEYKPVETMSGFKAGSILSAILSHEKSVKPGPSIIPVKYLLLKRLSVAAVFILLLGAGGYFLIIKQSRPVTSNVAKPARPARNDAYPGMQKAILTLSDGSKIVLDSMANGLLAQQGEIKIINNRGELTYNIGENTSGAMLYNTLHTQRGELYPLRLSDGTKIWLNSSSSIRFPVAFYTNEREVEITGEAYFEVARNRKKPFRVRLNGMEIEVLGTHFNVNSYPEEATIKTTLLEGSVKVTRGDASLFLLPGQQASVQESGKIDLVKKVDIEEAVSWKDGYFHFNNASLEMVMHQLSRWYDVEVVYEGKDSGQFFGGDIERNLQLSQVLKILEKSQVHFRIRDKTLIVLPKK